MALLAAHWTTATEKRNVESAKVILSALCDYAKVFGLEAPVHMAVGISEAEFARQASELLAITGDEPLRKLVARNPYTDSSRPVIDGEVVESTAAESPETDEPWSNITPDYAVRGYTRRCRLTAIRASMTPRTR